MSQPLSGVPCAGASPAPPLTAQFHSHSECHRKHPPWLCCTHTPLPKAPYPVHVPAAHHTATIAALHRSMSRRRFPGCFFQHYCPTRPPRRPEQYDEHGGLSAKYPKEHLINSNTAGYTGTAHFPANIVAIGGGNGNRQLSTADAESALLEAAKAGAHEALDSSTLEDSSLPALMTEI